MHAKLRAAWLVTWLCGSSAVGQVLAAAIPAVAPLRVLVVGASLSAGFIDGPFAGGNAENHTIALARLLRSWLGSEAKVQNRSDLLMFMDPTKIGMRQMERAKQDGGDLLFAMDFLFWYGYGYTELAPLDERKARMDRLELGLAQLGTWQGPIVLADFPDMRGAARRMLSPLQVPRPVVLDALNVRVVEWAKARDHCCVLPLRALVTGMKESGVQMQLLDGPLFVKPMAMLQSDQLHPNRLGMAWFMFQIQDPVRNLLTSQQAALLPKWTIDQCVAAADATMDVAEMRADADSGDTQQPASPRKKSAAKK